jgi:aspartate-semialdehyde dehydrogenase
LSEETPLTLAVYGAAGALGRELLIALEGQGLPIDRLIPVGAARSVGDQIRWRNRLCRVVGTAEVVPSEVDCAILATPSPVARNERPRLTQAGVLTIDCTAGGRAELPVLWPSLNRQMLETHQGAFAMAGALSSTVGPVVAGLAGVGPLQELTVVALETATASGIRGPELLSSQTVALLGSRVPDRGGLEEILAFNASGGVQGRPLADQEALDDDLPKLCPGVGSARIDARSVQIPAFAGLLCDLLVRFARPDVGAAEVQRALGARTDLVVLETGPTLRDALEQDEVLVGPPEVTRTGAVRLWIAADPLHRIAEAVAMTLEHIHRENLW